MAIKEPRRNRASRINLGLNVGDFEIPNLIEAQIKSFEWFKENGFRKLFDEINPVKDTMEKMWTLEFKEFRWGKPNRTIEDAVLKGLAYDAPLYVKAQLLNNKTGEIKEQEVFVVDVPLMTDEGYFVINGVKRVVTHQIVRAEGVLFSAEESIGLRKLCNAVLMPERGAWYEFEVTKHNVVGVRLVQKRPKILITELLRVFGYEDNDKILALFKDVDTDADNKYIEATLARDFTKSKEEAIISVYNKLRPDESVTLESAEKYIKSLFFNERKFDLGRIGRYQLNRKLNTDYPLDLEHSRLYMDDIILIIKRLIQINNGVIPPDDIDHLANRRIRSVGEILIDQLRVGVRRVEKNIRDKMSMYGEDAKLTPSALASTKPISAAMMSFFGQNQLSVFMEQTNILSEIENKRKVTASGPGGIVKERAPFSLREVHHSQYSRFCPVTSPESQSIGVVTQLAAYARVNEYGFIEAPYRRVMQTAKNDGKDAVNRIAVEDLEVGGKKIVKARETISADAAKKLASDKKLKTINVVSYITEDIEYLDADSEEGFHVSMCDIAKDEHGNIVETLVPTRYRGEFILQDVQLVNYVDVSSMQQAGLGMSLIPFVANDDSKRALMASNQQRQAVPLVKQQSPYVGTGAEETIAKQTNWGFFAEDDGIVKVSDARNIVVDYKKLGLKEYKLQKFSRSNQDTSFSQYSRVLVGQKVEKGDLLADGPNMVGGELSLGINLRVALMFYEGYNYEDSAVISERLVKEDLLTSVHIKEYSAEIRDTELGPETLTCDIPHVGDRVLAKLDSSGVVRIGSRVQHGDILAGIVAPQGEKELSAEERLLRAIFGESASNVRDNSLRLPHGEQGVVIRTQVLSLDKNNKLPPGVLKQVKVWVAQTKKISYGDKIAGRHGDKSTIAAIRAVEDMPYTKEGPVDIVLTPTFVKRMNMGQAVELHYGKYACMLGEKLAFPIFDKSNIEWLTSAMKQNGFEMTEKEELYDGRTGEKFPAPVTVGIKYVLKLKHIADEKVHARSTGPYTLVTQQPLGGKAQMGGQRFGEMEVWALESHGASFALQEMLTIKSDDVLGRAAAYKAIIHGEKIESVNIPESFKVLIRELNALCLNIDLISNVTDNASDEQAK